MKLNEVKRRALERVVMGAVSAFRGEVLTEDEVRLRVEHYLGDQKEELKVERKAKKEVEDVIEAVVKGMREMWGL